MPARRRVKSGGLPYPPDPAENRRRADGPARPDVDAEAERAARSARSAREHAGRDADIAARDDRREVSSVRARVEICECGVCSYHHDVDKKCSWRSSRSTPECASPGSHHLE